MAHRVPRVSPALLAAGIFILVTLAGCQRRGLEDLVGDDLFTLSLGKLPDQIDLFQFEGAMTEKRNSIFMRDGWFYVANGNAGKIMVFSSYGDLIFLLYNPQTNPAPVGLLGAPANGGGTGADTPGGTGTDTNAGGTGAAASGGGTGAAASARGTGAAASGGGTGAAASARGTGAAANGNGTPASASATGTAAAPSSAAAGTSSSMLSTRGAVAFPFTDIGEIAVASDRTLYVDDQIAEAKVVPDPARGLKLSRVVLRFDRKGKALGYLGQEGIGGTPFPYISALYVTGNDQLVVVGRLPDASWEVYWFSRDAVLLYKASIDAAHLPSPATSKSEPILVSIFPDAQSPLLYLAIDTYSTSGASLAADGPTEVSARVYRLDLRTRRYDPKFVEFPPNPPRRERVQLKTTEIPSPPSELLGLGPNGAYYALAATDTNLYTLQVFDAAGRLKAARRVAMEDTDLTFRDVHLSSAGILYGLFADRTKAHVSWWRSDLVPMGRSQ